MAPMDLLWIAFGLMSLNTVGQSLSNYNSIMRARELRKEVEELKKQLQEAYSICRL
jgi:hypothetical protein